MPKQKQSKKHYCEQCEKDQKKEQEFRNFMPAKTNLDFNPLTPISR